MNKGVVLVVDNETATRDILNFYLRRAGYQVILAEEGEQALDEMAKVTPDLIISALRMPQMGGDDLCLEVKGDPKTKDIYFILMSPTDDTAIRIGGLALGADDIVVKPFHAQEMLARVHSAFRIIGMQKEIKRQNRELLEYQERVSNELELAAKLQVGLLPILPGILPGLHYTHRYLPATGLGGDIYSIAHQPSGSIAIVLADVSGHGVSAALISAMVKTSFESQIRLGDDPLVWAEGMNRDLARNTLAEQFATAFIACLDPQTHKLAYVVAGQNPPIQIPGGATGGKREPLALAGKGFMLGLDEDMPFMKQEISLEPGDRLVLYTDGIVEVEREDHRMLEEAGLLDLCRNLPAHADEAAGFLVEQARAFNYPSPFVDDVTLVVLDRVP